MVENGYVRGQSKNLPRVVLLIFAAAIRNVKTKWLEYFSYNLQIYTKKL